MGFILVINAGSSSLKFKLFDGELAEVASGLAEKISLSGSFLTFKFGDEKNVVEKLFRNHESALNEILWLLKEKGVDFCDIKKVGHRVVHGSDKFIAPIIVTDAVLRELEQFNDLAPLHNPHNLKVIELTRKILDKATHYAVFDTAFHQTMPEYAFRYGLPSELYAENKIRRYGFQGLSHEYVTLAAAKKLKKKNPNLIICHLGSGASITAVKNGKSVDTSMGFTPLEGLMMMSRSGDIDAGVVFYLAKHGFTLKKIEDILNHESGLLGVSGLKDMRDIMMACGYKIEGYQAPEFAVFERARAKLALQMFVYRIKKYIGAYYAILGKVDALVLTAGIGERNADVRKLITKGLPFKMKILVIPTDEERMIAMKIGTGN